MNFAIIGTNVIVDSFLKAALKLPEFNFYAIYSRQLHTGQKKAAQFGGAKTFTNLTKMLEDEAIDAVYIASPNSLHAPKPFNA